MSTISHHRGDPINAEEIPVVPLIVGGLGLLYFGDEVEKQRNKLRQIFNAFDREESEIAGLLESMVESGDLKPFVFGERA